MTTLQQHNETVIAAKLPELAKETNPKQRQLHAELMLKNAELIKRHERLKEQLTCAKDMLNLASEMFTQSAYLLGTAHDDLERHGSAEADKALSMVGLGLRESESWAEIMGNAVKSLEVQNV